MEFTWGFTLIVFAIGIGAGILSAVFGVGGGFIFTPLFHAGFHFPPVVSVATSMAQIPFTTFSGFLKYLGKVKIKFKDGLIMLAGAVPGSQLAVYGYKKLAPLLDTKKVLGDSNILDLFLAISFSILLFSLATYTIRKNKENKAPVKKASNVTTFAWGIFIGLLSGVYGVGGGFLAVPYFLHKKGFSAVESSATSLFVIFPMAFITAAHYWWLGQVAVYPAMAAAAGGILGARAGAHISLKAKEKHLKTALGIFQMCIGIIYVLTKIL